MLLSSEVKLHLEESKRFSWILLWLVLTLYMYIVSSFVPWLYQSGCTIVKHHFEPLWMRPIHLDVLLMLVHVHVDTYRIRRSPLLCWLKTVHVVALCFLLLVTLFGLWSGTNCSVMFYILHGSWGVNFIGGTCFLASRRSLIMLKTITKA